MPFILSLLLSLLAPVAGLTTADMAALEKGDVPVKSETFTLATGNSAGRGVGAIIVDRPIGEVWTHLTRYEDKADYMPRMMTCTVLEKHPDRVRVKMKIDASVTTALYTAWYDLDEAKHVVHWTLDKTATDNTIREVDGDYRLFTIEPGPPPGTPAQASDRTIVVYRTYVDPGRGVPTFIQNYMAKKSIPNLLKAIKKRVESGGTWKK